MPSRILIRGGEVLDPGQGISRQRLDVLVADGKIAQLAENIRDEPGMTVVDARGKIVTPGLIDLHTHVNYGGDGLSVQPDVVAAFSGVTTFVDTGSSGASNFLGFRRNIIRRSRVRIIPFLHISALGLTGIDVGVGESENMGHLSIPAALKTVEKHRDLIAGIKVRATSNATGRNGLYPVEAALEAAQAARLTLMVHIGFPLERVLALMRPGDILTHCFWAPRDLEDGVIGPDGKVKPVVLEHWRRGIVFDIGHGAGAFVFRIGRPMLEQGYPPDVISTDVHALNIAGPVFDLPTTLSKFMALGMSLEDVVLRATARPAEVLGLTDRSGSLRVGAPGDVAVFDLEEGAFDYRDVEGAVVRGNRRLKNLVTVARGEILDRAAICRDEGIPGPESMATRR